MAQNDQSDGPNKQHRNAVYNGLPHLVAARKHVDHTHIAKPLKEDCEPFFQKHFGISAFTEISLEKELIRPMLVEYGQAMKKKFGDTIWMDKAIAAVGTRGIVPDVRFPIEIDAIKGMGGTIVYVDKIGVAAANKLEERHDKVLRDKADYVIRWPHYGDVQSCEVDVEGFMENFPGRK